MSDSNGLWAISFLVVQYMSKRFAYVSHYNWETKTCLLETK